MLSTGYLDYARWQRQWLGGPEAAASCRYWRNRLDGAKAPRLAGYRGPQRTAVGAQAMFRLPANLVDGLAALSAAAEVTLFTTLLAGFSAVVSAAERTRNR